MHNSNSAGVFPSVSRATSAWRSESAEAGAPPAGGFPSAGTAVYFTATSPSLNGTVLQ